MKNKSELKETDIKNRVCFYFDDIVNGTKINFSNISLNINRIKSYENISVYKISYKTPTGSKPLRMRLDKINKFIMSLGGEIKQLVLFDYKLLDKICDITKYLINIKSGIKNSINYNLGKIKVDSYNSLLIKKY